MREIILPHVLPERQFGLMIVEISMRERRRRPVWICVCAFVLAAGQWIAGAQAPSAVGPAARLFDVESAFSRIAFEGEHLTAGVNGQIPKGQYRQSLFNFFGMHNHFQGIQRLPETDYLVVSGSNPSTSELFVIQLSGDGRLADHRIVSRIGIDPVMWHAGGLSVEGSILAVPLYGGSPRRGRILFYDLSDPEHPRKLPTEIDRLGRKSSAVALTTLPNGRYLAAVLAAYDGLPRRVDFYMSRSERFEDGFGASSVTMRASEVQARQGQERTFSHFQNINFIWQADDKLYLVGFHNKLFFQSRWLGADRADLYEVTFPREMTDASEPQLVAPSLIKAASRPLRCSDGYCNLDAAAGLYVDVESQSMTVYATPGWLSGDRLKFTVYGEAR